MASGSSSSSLSRIASSEQFFCHTCNGQVDHVQQDYTCPVCHTGFLERLVTSSSSSSSSAPVHSNDVAFQQIFQQLIGGFVSGSDEQQPSGARSGRRGQRGEAVQGDILGMFLQQLMQNLNAEGAQIHFRIGDDGNEGGPAVFHFPPLHGNPGDYAWGPGGLDQVVTQLLNQFEGGAPPLQKADIGRIPEVAITAENVENRMQCTTCMDDFSLGEKVLRLPCEHRFHSACIVPWLQRHNTCPICRKTVGAAETSETASTTDSADSSTPTTTPMVDTIDELD